MTIGIRDIQHSDTRRTSIEYRHTVYRYAERRNYLNALLNVIMLNVVMLGVMVHSDAQYKDIYHNDIQHSIKGLHVTLNTRSTA